MRGRSHARIAPNSVVVVVIRGVAKEGGERRRQVGKRFVVALYSDKARIRRRGVV